MLRYLFLDMNSFFASVEQQEQPQLRGQPVGVVPSKAETTCCIAASYEAKAFGVSTGTGVQEARRLCPNIRFVVARPKLYVQYHHRIVAVVEDCIHVEQVCSIDELYCKLLRNERSESQAAAISYNIKRALYEQCGPHVRCSIGIAPNAWLAKVATNLEKPDGFVVIDHEHLPNAICSFELTDLPGIAKGYARRLRRHGVLTVRQLCDCSEKHLQTIFGSRIVGSLWWHQLRGDDLPLRPTKRRTVGHSHVLPPKLRTDDQAFSVLVRMTHKAAYRMRKLGYHAGRVSCGVSYFGNQRQWQDYLTLGPTRDTFRLINAVKTLWQRKPTGTPLKVSVVLTNLLADRAATPALFPSDQKASALADAMDGIDEKFGIHTVYSAAMHGFQQNAPTRISFTQIPELSEFGE